MPTTNARVGIEIYVDDQGTLRVREFTDKTNKSLDDVANKSQSVTGRMKAGWESLKGAWVGVLAGIMAMREAWSLMNTAAQAQQEQVAFENLARSYGVNSKKIIADLKEASNGTVDTMTMIRKAGTAMMMGIAPEDVTRLMKVAAATAKMTGQTVTKAFEDISLASARQSKMIMDNLGIIINLEDAYENYAEKLNIVGRELTDTEKKQAFLSEAFEQGGDLMDKLGNQANTAADRFQRFTATAENIKVAVGGGLVRVFYGAKAALEGLSSGLLTLAKHSFSLASKLAVVSDKLNLTNGMSARMKINMQAAGAAAEDMAGKSIQSFKDMATSHEDVIKAQAKHKKIIKDTTKAIEDQVKAEKKLIDQQKKVLEDAKNKAKEQADATAEMYKEAGLGADAYFEQESSKLVEKAAKWEEAGADQLEVEEWLYDELGKLSEEAWGRGEEAAGQYLDSVQTQSRTLVEEFNELQQTAQEKLDAIAGQAAALDGTDIGLTVSFDGSAAMAGYDALIAKIRALQEVAARTDSSSSNRDSRGDSTQQSSDQSSSRQSSSATTSNAASAVTVKFSQKLSRSDVVAIIAEQQRRERRG